MSFFPGRKKASENARNRALSWIKAHILRYIVIGACSWAFFFIVWNYVIRGVIEAVGGFGAGYLWKVVSRPHNDLLASVVLIVCVVVLLWITARLFYVTRLEHFFMQLPGLKFISRVVRGVKKVVHSVQYPALVIDETDAFFGCIFFSFNEYDTEDGPWCNGIMVPSFPSLSVTIRQRPKRKLVTNPQFTAAVAFKIILSGGTGVDREVTAVLQELINESMRQRVK